MIKYPNFVIYRMYDNDNFCYIGSTSNFKRRISQHKKNTYNKRNKTYHNLLYSYIRGIGGWDNMKYEILEKYPVDDLKDGRIKEQEYIEKYNSKMNTINSCKI